ncbi:MULTISPECIES: DUF6022 family protein [Thermoactinomyces]|uniref:DUF6022 family protein n=1 Tax=Thermoactinomyces TaxID=2023 RepID=UPI000673B29F|nr:MULTISPECIES: DUF6022 family protein [Thermoactinomyces]MBH8584184.1 hypothetical protein [Thermoactinomyces sp. CICC 10735]MBH8586668.1 hypothetical protein [Thermoactinomyces sp. CICC 10520]QBK12560.1 hypothetical protein AB849_002250 [Thermoactinomyces vulgaris]
MIQKKTWNEFFKPDQAITIQGIAKYFNHVIQEQWEVILKEYREEWNRKFYEIGEQVYGLYLGKVLNPVFRELSEAGFVTKPGFILPNSIEHWGPPEERERCMWCVVKDQNGTPLGTLVLRVFHSHVRFNVPHAPDVFSLEETEREAIQNAICNASVRLNQKIPRGLARAKKRRVGIQCGNRPRRLPECRARGSVSILPGPCPRLLGKKRLGTGVCCSPRKSFARFFQTSGSKTKLTAKTGHHWNPVQWMTRF